MSEDVGDIEEVLVSSIASMIAEVGESVAEAQLALTRAQINSLKSLDSELIDAGFMPAFFHMREVDVEMNMSLHVERESETTGSEGGRKRKWRLLGAPSNPATTSKFNRSLGGSSTLTLRFSPAPPPLKLQVPDDR